MSVAEAEVAIRRATVAEKRRLDETHRLRRLLARSDALLDQAERANERDLELRPRFASALRRLAGDMAPSLLTPRPERLNGLHVRLGLTLRGWSRARLAAVAKVRHDYITRSLQSSTTTNETTQRICHAFASHPPGGPGATPREPLGAQEMVDLVFDLQEVLFGLIAEEAGRPEPVEERLTADVLAAFGRACRWLDSQPNGRVRDDEMPAWLEQMIDHLNDHHLARSYDAKTWGASTVWRLTLDALERQLREAEGQS